MDQSCLRALFPRVLGGIGLFVLLASGLVSCSNPDPEPAPDSPHATNAATNAATPGSGEIVVDSFGNADFYTTVPDDTYESVVAKFDLPEAKIAEFNAFPAGVPLSANVKLRLLPVPGPIRGAMGASKEDTSGLPLRYEAVENDTVDGLRYRFGLSKEQLAEANMVPDDLNEKGVDYFLHPGSTIELQKRFVAPASGTGTVVRNSFGNPLYYTTVDGDTFDSLGYKFRRSPVQLLQDNATLGTGGTIPVGTKLSLGPLDTTIDGARGSYTKDAVGLPLTYTTAAGDVEARVALRFNLSTADLGSVNRPVTPGGRVWYGFADLPNGVISPGQTISISKDTPIVK